MIRSVGGVTVLLVGVLSGCQPAPSSPPELRSPSGASATPTEVSAPPTLATPVPGSISSNTETGAGTLRPLLPDQLSLVRVTAAAAAHTVLANKEATGWPEVDIAWQDGGCVLLAWYVRHPMSYAPNPPPPSAVFVVRLVSKVDRSRQTWVIVDATTGELGAAGSGPSNSDCP